MSASPGLPFPLHVPYSQVELTEWGGWERVSWCSDWQTALFQRLTKTRVFNTTQNLKLSLKTCHTVTPQAPRTAQLCVLYVDKLQTAKTKPRSTKCTGVCSCLGWPWGGKKGTLAVRNCANSTSSNHLISFITTQMRKC